MSIKQDGVAMSMTQYGEASGYSCSNYDQQMEQVCLVAGNPEFFACL